MSDTLEPRSLRAILVAEDDPDDRLLMAEAHQEGCIEGRLDFVADGEALLAYLRYEGEHAGRERRQPSLILLDLNMPRMDGRATLARIKADPELRHIPVIVFTTSRAEEDVRVSYEQGGNAYIVKPSSFAELVEALRALQRHWFEVAELPPERPTS